MLKKSLLILSVVSLLNGSSTMCFKKDHTDPDTIETIPLKGGICNNEKSVIDMKKDGYSVEDIKISNGDTGLNYIYIFKQDNKKVISSKEEIKEQIQAIKDDEKKVDLIAGEKIYKNTCNRCHGDGTISAYNKARPLANLTIEDIEVSIRAYSLDEKDNGMAMLMKPIANSLMSNDIKNVAAYIQTLKK